MNSPINNNDNKQQYNSIFSQNDELFPQFASFNEQNEDNANKQNNEINLFKYQRHTSNNEQLQSQSNNAFHDIDQSAFNHRKGSQQQQDANFKYKTNIFGAFGKNRGSSQTPLTNRSQKQIENEKYEEIQKTQNYKKKDLFQLDNQQEVQHLINSHSQTSMRNIPAQQSEVSNFQELVNDTFYNNNPNEYNKASDGMMMNKYQLFPKQESIQKELVIKPRLEANNSSNDNQNQIKINGQIKDLEQSEISQIKINYTQIKSPKEQQNINSIYKQILDNDLILYNQDQHDNKIVQKQTQNTLGHETQSKNDAQIIEQKKQPSLTTHTTPNKIQSKPQSDLFQAFSSIAKDQRDKSIYKLKESPFYLNSIQNQSQSPYKSLLNNRLDEKDKERQSQNNLDLQNQLQSLLSKKNIETFEQDSQLEASLNQNSTPQIQGNNVLDLNESELNNSRQSIQEASAEPIMLDMTKLVGNRETPKEKVAVELNTMHVFLQNSNHSETQGQNNLNVLSDTITKPQEQQIAFTFADQYRQTNKSERNTINQTNRFPQTDISWIKDQNEVINEISRYDDDLQSLNIYLQENSKINFTQQDEEFMNQESFMQTSQNQRETHKFIHEKVNELKTNHSLKIDQIENNILEQIQNSSEDQDIKLDLDQVKTDSFENQQHQEINSNKIDLLIVQNQVTLDRSSQSTTKKDEQFNLNTYSKGNSPKQFDYIDKITTKYFESVLKQQTLQVIDDCITEQRMQMRLIQRNIIEPTLQEDIIDIITQCFRIVEDEIKEREEQEEMLKYETQQKQLIKTVKKEKQQTQMPMNFNKGSLKDIQVEEQQQPNIDELYNKSSQNNKPLQGSPHTRHKSQQSKDFNIIQRSRVQSKADEFNVTCSFGGPEYVEDFFANDNKHNRNDSSPEFKQDRYQHITLGTQYDENDEYKHLSERKQTTESIQKQKFYNTGTLHDSDLSKISFREDIQKQIKTEKSPPSENDLEEDEEANLVISSEDEDESQENSFQIDQLSNSNIVKKSQDSISLTNLSIDFKDNKSSKTSRSNMKSMRSQNQVSSVGVRSFQHHRANPKFEQDESPFIYLTTNPSYLDVLCANCYECVRFQEADSHSRYCVAKTKTIQNQNFNDGFEEPLYKQHQNYSNLSNIEDDIGLVNSKIVKLMNAVKNRIIEIQIQDQNNLLADNYSSIYAVGNKIINEDEDPNNLMIMEKIIEDFLIEIQGLYRTKQRENVRIGSLMMFTRRLKFLNQEKIQLLSKIMPIVNDLLYDSNSMTEQPDLQKRTQFILNDIRSEVQSEKFRDDQSEYSDYSAMSNGFAFNPSFGLNHYQDSSSRSYSSMSQDRQGRLPQFQEHQNEIFSPPFDTGKYIHKLNQEPRFRSQISSNATSPQRLLKSPAYDQKSNYSKYDQQMTANNNVIKNKAISQNRESFHHNQFQYNNYLNTSRDFNQSSQINYGQPSFQQYDSNSKMNLQNAARYQPTSNQIGSSKRNQNSSKNLNSQNCSPISNKKIQNKLSQGITSNLKKHFYSMTIEHVHKLFQGRMPEGISFTMLFKEVEEQEISIDEWENYIIMRLNMIKQLKRLPSAQGYHYQ